MRWSLLKFLVILGLFMAVFTVLPAHAHKVNVFAYVEDGKIYIESYFPDGKPAEGGAIEVLDSQSQKVAAGVTDKEGKCVIPVPKKDDLTIVINASMGHKNSYLLKKSEIGD
jgi:nickel transport protein